MPCCDNTVPIVEEHGQLLIKLNDGNKMPMVGLGTWQAEPVVVRKSVRDAVKAGYRLIDTALWYENEDAIGEELEALFKEGVVKREDLFITTKLHCSYMGHEDVIPILKKQLQSLRLTYVDLYIIHWPLTFAKDGTLNPIDPKTNKYIPDYTKHYTDTWKGMEDAKRAGLTKSIGVSNFNNRQLEDILLRCSIKPTVNQIESHPLLSSKQQVDWCQQHDIAVTAYSSFANPGNQFAPADGKYPDLLNDGRLKAIAAKYPGKTSAHVMLRWQIQRGVAVIPKSTSVERIKANLNVFDFKLTQEDMEAVCAMNKGIRICSFVNNGNSSHRDYPYDEYRDVADPWTVPWAQ